MAMAVSAVFSALFFPGLPAQAQAPEYQVKAAILYKIALFVDWPKKAFQTGTSPFAVCVLGEDPFGSWLHHEIGTMSVGSHPVQIVHPDGADAARKCNVIFISRSEQPRLSQTLAVLRNSEALIVSDIRAAGEFCRQGGMIALVLEDHKVRFELNSAAAQQAGLKIDSRLKRVAKSVTCGEAP